MLLNTRTYNRYRSSEDSVVYAGPDHTLSIVDTLELRRVLPKASSNGAGVARPGLKLTKDVLNATTGKLVRGSVTISGGFPVDAAITTAVIEGMIADLASFLGTADGKAVFSKLDLEV